MNRFCLLLFILCVSLGSCVSNNVKIEKVISFERNLRGSGEPEMICKLSEDSVHLKNITDFVLLNDSSFVVLDTRGAYKYDMSGEFKQQFGYSGRARGEMISPSSVYATSDFVYIWCSTLMKILIFDKAANFIDEISDFKNAVKKFVVTPNDETIYLYTTGDFDQSGNKMENVITVYEVSTKKMKKFGERASEDEVMSTWQGSGGLYVENGKFLYIHPANLIIHDRDLSSGNTLLYQIDDTSFKTEKDIDIWNIMNDRNKLTEYLYSNSLVRGFYRDNDRYVVVAETGRFDLRDYSSEERKIKLYILDMSFNPDRTIIYDYINSPNFEIYFGAMYFLTIQLINDDQSVALNRFFL